MAISMARANKRNERLGETFVNQMGSAFFIKEYNSRIDVVVKFCDEHGAEVHTSYQACQNGKVKNPYDKTVYNVACIGEIGDFKTYVNGVPNREYNLWKHMINRCYSGNYPTYANVTVCERWLVFANFLEDLPFIENYEWWLENENQYIALDKDLKQIGVENKVYSLETVKFVSASENTKEMNERKRKESTQVGSI
jgi:hypothetical protein